MVTKGYKDEKDAFFFFLQENSNRLLRRTLENDPEIRKQALKELRRVGLFLGDLQEDPEYSEAFINWRYRIREAGNPEKLATARGLENYYAFLFRHLLPYLGRLSESENGNALGRI